MKPHQQSFEIRIKENQLQALATYDSLGVASGGAVMRKPVDVEKNQSSLVAPPGIGVPPTAVDREFHDGTGVSTTGDDDIQVNMKALLVT